MATGGYDSGVDDLRAYLRARPTGELAIDDLVGHLSRAWGSLHGGGSEAMAARKVDRIERVTWQPPILGFWIERHGAVVGGNSTRGEMQHWEVDIDALTATVIATTHRQVRPAAPRLDVGPIAEDLAAAITRDHDDERLAWSADRNTVTIRTGSVIPATGFQQTVQGRRRRLRARLTELLSSEGWIEQSANKFVRHMHDER